MTEAPDFDSLGTPLGEYVPSATASTMLSRIKNDETNVRFLQELSEMKVVAFHFGTEADGGVSFPCAGNPDKCPGCQKGFDKTQRIIAVVQEIATGYINLLMIPISLKESMERNSDRDGTMKARNYTIYRSKTGNRTTYDLDRDDKSPAPEIEAAQMPDFGKVMAESWRWGTDAEYRASLREERKSGDKPKAKDSSVPVYQPPSRAEEPAPFENKVEEQIPRGTATEAEIRAMNYISLVKLAMENDVEINDDMNKQEVADAIIAKLS